MIVSFAEPLPAETLTQFLTEVEQVMRASGTLRSFRAESHVRVPGDDHPPTPVAITGTAIVQLGYADLGALNDAYDTPALGELIRRWQARSPYTLTMVNHEPLA